MTLVAASRAAAAASRVQGVEFDVRSGRRRDRRFRCQRARRGSVPDRPPGPPRAARRWPAGLPRKPRGPRVRPRGPGRRGVARDRARPRPTAAFMVSASISSVGVGCSSADTVIRPPFAVTCAGGARRTRATDNRRSEQPVRADSTRRTSRTGRLASTLDSGPGRPLLHPPPTWETSRDLRRWLTAQRSLPTRSATSPVTASVRGDGEFQDHDDDARTEVQRDGAGQSRTGQSGVSDGGYAQSCCSAMATTNATRRRLPG